MERIANYIKNVRLRTEAEKQKAVFLWTFVLIIIIFLVWLLSFILSVANNNAEEARLQAEAKVLAEAKVTAALSDEATTTKQFKGVIPMVIDFTGDSFDNIINGFWVIGNALHK